MLGQIVINHQCADHRYLDIHPWQYQRKVPEVKQEAASDGLVATNCLGPSPSSFNRREQSSTTSGNSHVSIYRQFLTSLVDHRLSIAVPSYQFDPGRNDKLRADHTWEH